MNTPSSHSFSRRRFLGGLSLAAVGSVLAPSLRAEDAAPARKLGVALVGLGSYSTGQLGPALRETRFCKLAGVVTGDPAKGKKWAADYGFPEKNVYGYEGFASIAENKDIDVLYIVTPTGLHAEHAIAAAAKAGKHVIVEKPMAGTAAECDAIIAACAKAKVKLSVGYRLHFDPYHRELARHGKEKDFGIPLKMKGERKFRNAGGTWRTQRKLGCGGPLMDIGIYLVQGGIMGAGGVAPVAVTAKEHPNTRPTVFKDVEEGLDFTMEFADGSVLEASTSYAGGGRDAFRMEGPKGWLEFKQKAFTYSGAVVETSLGPLSFSKMNQQAAQMDDFAQCIQTGRETPVGGAMGRRDVAILEAIYEAMRTGQKVPVKV